MVPTANRTKAVIAPLLNFETWFNNGSPSGNPTFGNPIELNLEGRGIRDIVRLSNGVFIIVAGHYDGSPLNGAIYKWTGNATDAPVQISTMDIVALNAEACLEINESSNLALNKLQIISDNGSFEFYNDGTQAKDLSQDNYKKYRSDIITAPSNVLPIQLDYFTVTKQNNNAVLNWKVLESSGVKQFEVFRSINNSNNFTSIATINKSNDKTNYSFTDKILQATTVYYKIKLIEPNGNSTYSNIRAISFTEKNAILKVYPNPVIANSFSVTTDIVGYKKVDIYNSTGALITTLNFTDTALDIQTNHWSKGNYLLVVSSNNIVVGKEKVVIQ